MIPIIPYSHYYWVGGPPKVLQSSRIRSYRILGINSMGVFHVLLLENPTP